MEIGASNATIDPSAIVIGKMAVRFYLGIRR